MIKQKVPGQAQAGRRKVRRNKRTGRFGSPGTNWDLELHLGCMHVQCSKWASASMQVVLCLAESVPQRMNSVVYSVIRSVTRNSFCSFSVFLPFSNWHETSNEAFLHENIGKCLSTSTQGRVLPGCFIESSYSTDLGHVASLKRLERGGFSPAILP